jgi:predicted DNA-binding protein
MKEDQLTLRLPRDLARLLARRARERGLPKSQVVREAIQVYLASASPPVAGAAWDRVKHMVGSLEVDNAAIERDPVARLIKKHNWRD